MKKVLKFVGIGFVALILVLVGVAYALPKEVVVERDTTIGAPQEKVFSHLNTFKHFNEWSPWAKIDPDTEYTMSGPETGVGAKMSWTSDHSSVGNGSQEIVKSEPHSYVENKLDFDGQPTSYAYFELEPADGGTHVVWGLRANMGNNPIGRWMGLMMEGMLGPQYEEGLAGLKKHVESK